MDGRTGKHGSVDTEKIWFDEAPNERVIDEEIIFFSKVGVVREEKADGDFGMMTFDPVDDARVETLKINFRITVAFEIFFERGEDGFAEEGNIGISGGFKFDEKGDFGVN